MKGLKNRYDFAFSLGGTCTCSTVLRRLGMQYASYPFDWASTLSMLGNARVLIGGAEQVISASSLELMDSTYTGEGKVSYRSRDNGMWYVHDFCKGIDFKDQYLAIADKYRRRMSRLIERIEQSRDVLVVYTQLPNCAQTADAEVIATYEMLQRKFSSSGLDFLYVAHEARRRLKDCTVENLAPHVIKASLDILQYDAGNEFTSDRRVIAPLIRALVPDGVVDYRTSAEKQAWENLVREKKYRAMHASSWFEYAVNRFNWLMFRHFRNRLEKLGFENLPSHRA